MIRAVGPIPVAGKKPDLPGIAESDGRRKMDDADPSDRFKSLALRIPNDDVNDAERSGDGEAVAAAGEVQS